MVAKKILEMDEFDLYWRWSDHLARSTDDVIFLLQNRLMFRDIAKMFDEKPELGGETSPVLRWMWRCWGTEAVMGIRRELDDQAGAINLRHLLYEIESRPEVMNRERFVDMALLEVDCGDFEARDKANALFDTFCLTKSSVHPALDHINPAGVAADRLALEHEAGEAFQFAQTYIAHRTPLDPDLYLNTLDRAIDGIVAALQKYTLIIDAEPLDLSLVVLPPEWQPIFEVAWRPKSSD